MRGHTTRQVELFSYVPLESQVPKGHPLRRIRDMIEPVLERLSPEFEALYSDTGRPSIPPEQLLKALLLQVLYTIRSELQLMEQIRFNLLYRWFVGLSPDDRVWDPTVFTKNRDRLMEGEVSRRFFEEILGDKRVKKLVSRDHFTVDGTLIEAWASHKSFQPKGEPEKRGNGNPSGGCPRGEVDFHGQKRTNDTHESTTDPDSRLYRKSRGDGAKMSYLGHVMMENRNGLAVDARVTKATGTAEREAAFDMAEDLPGSHRKTLGGDKNYDTRELVEDLQSLNVTPHVAQNTANRSSAIDGRTTRHDGYEVSQRVRKRVEEIFGWLKTVGLMRKTHFRGTRKVGWMFVFALSVYNLVRITNLLGGGL
jgi:transposase